jgi:hypothetical protein
MTASRRNDLQDEMALLLNTAVSDVGSSSIQDLETARRRVAALRVRRLLGQVVPAGARRGHRAMVPPRSSVGFVSWIAPLTSGGDRRAPPRKERRAGMSMEVRLHGLCQQNKESGT